VSVYVIYNAVRCNPHITYATTGSNDTPQRKASTINEYEQRDINNNSNNNNDSNLPSPPPRTSFKASKNVGDHQLKHAKYIDFLYATSTQAYMYSKHAIQVTCHELALPIVCVKTLHTLSNNITYAPASSSLITNILSTMNNRQMM
jgi:hypothetical protein